MKRKIVFLIIAASLFLISTTGNASLAMANKTEGKTEGLLLSPADNSEPQKLEKEDLHIIFAVDHSGSMNKYNEAILLENVLSSLVDTMWDKPVSVGYVSYNDKILVSKPPLSLQSPGQAEELKEIITSSVNQGETDIGLGLKEAYRLLDGYPGPGMIILISDGETDLANSSTGRTEQDSEQDIQEVIAGCISQKIPVFTIALGMNSDTAGLGELSRQTHAGSYTAQVPAEIIDILLPLFYQNPGDGVYEIGTGVYQAGIQKINYQGNEFYDKTTLLLLSDQEIKNAEISNGSEDDTTMIPISPSGNYAVAKLNNGSNGDSNGFAATDFTVNIETAANQTISAYVIGERLLTPVMAWQGALYKNQPLDFTVTFEDLRGNRITAANPGVYDRNPDNWKAGFIDSHDGSIQEVILNSTGDGLSGTVSFASSGDYNFYMEALENGTYTGNTYIARDIQIMNNLPDSIQSGLLELLTITEQQVIDLDQYFKDADQDTLTYEIQAYPQQVVSVFLDQNLLYMTPGKSGSGEVALLISDGEGSLTGRIPVRVKNLLEAYWPAWLLIIVTLLLFFIIKLYVRNKRTGEVIIPIEDKKDCWFTGKLNAYFTRLPEGTEEIPPLTFALHHLREKRIVLGNMFKNHPDIADLLELENIVLLPAENRKVILYHNTNAAIMLGNSIVCKKMQYLVSYGNIIYVTSKDGTCELEIHYVSMI